MSRPEPGLVSEGIATLRPYVAGKPLEELAREKGILDAVKLASNENPLGPSPAVLRALSAALPNIHRYPDANAFELRTKLSQRLGVRPDQLVFGNGSNELIELLVRTFCPPGSHLVFAEPSFVVYRMAALAQGVAFTAVPLREHRHDLRALLAAITPDTRLVLIANPNNPTGTHVGEAELREFLQAVPPQVIVALDEAYIEYATADDFPDGLRLQGCRERLVMLRTFSKAYGLAGLRLGYALGPANLCDYLERVRAPFNANALAQVAACAVLDDPEYLAQGSALNAAERLRVSQGLSRLGLKVAPSQANFVLVELQRSASEVFDALLDHGVITRLVPPLPQALRISIGTREENSRMLAAMERVLS